MIRTSRHSIVATPAGGLRLTTSIREHQVLTDQPQKVGGDDAAPTPLELLGASLAACVALYVKKFCDASGLDADEMGVEVKPFWRDDPGRVGRYDVVVHVPATIPDVYHAEIERVAQTCPVHHTLTHAPEVTTRVQVAIEATAVV
jgi:putative redox protein